MVSITSSIFPANLRKKSFCSVRLYLLKSNSLIQPSIVEHENL
jgi:hypothetical protein